MKKPAKTTTVKTIFITDIAMAILFAGVLTTGIGVHRIGEISSHEAWHNWSVAHFFLSLSWLIAMIFHIKHHLNWYRSIFKNRSLKHKSHITAILTIIATATIFTGVSLLIFVDGQGSHLGLIHYIIGFILGLFCIGHLVKRFTILRKGLSKLNERR